MWPENKQVAVSLTFDDARLSQVETGMEILDGHGVKATFYVQVGNMERRLDEWRKAVAAGHEIGNHTLTHPCSGNFVWSRGRALEDYTLERMQQELDDANQVIEEKLGVRPTTFAYPCGQKFVGRGETVQSYVPLVARTFRAGRGFRDEAANDPTYCDLAQLCGVDADGLSGSELLAWVDRARECGGWLVFAGHEIGEAGRQTVLSTALDELCAYAGDPANGVWMTTVADAAERVMEA